MSSPEIKHTLNLEVNLTRQLKLQTDAMVGEFIDKHYGDFDTRKVNKEIVRDSNELRKNVLNMLESACSSILLIYGKNSSEIDQKILEKKKNQEFLTEDEKKEIELYNTYNAFIQKHGWYEHVGIRHQITRDELAYELCEVIRKIYYVYMEDQIPEKYRTEIIETYLLKEENVSTN